MSAIQSALRGMLPSRDCAFFVSLKPCAYAYYDGQRSVLGTLGRAC